MSDWGTSAIANELAGAGKGLNVTLAVLADAAGYAERAAEKMVGLPGVARGIRAIKQAIEASHHQVQNLSDALAPLNATVEAITADSTPGQVIAALDLVPEELRQRAVDTMRTKAALGDTETLIRRNLAGGQPQHLLYRVGKARSVLDVVRQRFDKAKDATDTVLDNARGAGEAGWAGAAGQTGTAGGSGQEPPGEPESVGPDAGVPSFVQRIAGDFHHVSADSDRPAHWVYKWDVVRRHVEGHAAALLRRPGAPAEAVLVVSQEPCRRPRGCHWALPYILGEDVKLHVYVVELGQRPRFHKTYGGNGKAVGDG